MDSEVMMKMNGYLSQNYPALWRKAYRATSRQGWSHNERAVRLILLTVGTDTRMLAEAFTAAGIR